LIDADVLADQIILGPPVEGVTFLGGEPFFQAMELAYVGRRVRDHGLSVVTFTGYRLEALKVANRPSYEALLAVTDLLIDGPFQREKADLSRPWVGSSNQRFHFLTDRYKYLVDELSSIPNRIEVRLSLDGRVLINGLVSPEDLKALIQSAA
jgi:anaerobic ribonucleoside-triphosphate reductase activating protein